MLWARRIWATAMGLFTVAFVTGTHLPTAHLYLALPGMAFMLTSLAMLLFNRRASVRVRGSAITLFLLFFLSAVLGWSVVADTMPPLIHGVCMGIFGLGAVYLTYELYWPAVTRS